MNNNFNVMRLFAAWLVLASHSFTLTGQREPLGQLTGFLTGGGLAVDVFFFISGYVVTQSALRRDLLTFCKARTLRILPGLALVTILSLLLGAGLTTLSQFEYWQSDLTWSYARNVILFPMHFKLPGVFAELPTSTVNGSLWTLPLEVTMYLCSAIFIILRLRSGSAYVLIALMSFIAYFVATRHFGLSWSSRGPALLPGVRLFNILSFGYLYFAGAALATATWLRPNNVTGFLSLLVLSGIPFLGPYAEPVFLLSLPFAIHWLAFGYQIQTLWKADISYGVYLYAFPVQQVVVQSFGSQIGPMALTAYATIPTLVLGFISWKVIEEPALQLKRRIESAAA